MKFECSKVLYWRDDGIYSENCFQIQECSSRVFESKENLNTDVSVREVPLIAM